MQSYKLFVFMQSYKLFVFAFTCLFPFLIFNFIYLFFAVSALPRDWVCTPAVRFAFVHLLSLSGQVHRRGAEGPADGRAV